MFSLKRCNFAVLVFFLFSIFYVWLSVGGSGCEREKAELWRDKAVGLKILLKILGFVDSFFSFVLPLKGIDRERLSLAQKNGGQTMR